MKTSISLLAFTMLLGLLLSTGLHGFYQVARADNSPQVVTTRYLAPTGTNSGDCTSASNPCQTIQYAVDQSTAGDELRLAEGTYSSVISLNGHNQMAWIDKSLGLYGGYTAAFTSRSPETTPTILDAAAQGRVIYASGAITLTLDGLQMIHGTTTGDPAWFMHGGAVYAAGTNLIVSSSQIRNSHTGSNYSTGGNGSGLYLSQGTLKMDQSILQGNSSLGAEALGGGLYATESAVEITNSSFLTNTAGVPGALGYGFGGGAYLVSTNTVIRGTTFKGNLGSTGSSGNGGGLYSLQGTLQLLDSTFDSNEAGNSNSNSWGGGLFLGTANAEVRGNTFINNSAHSMGGAIFIRHYWSSILAENRFENNHCTGCGAGAIMAYEYGPLQIENNQFIGNSATAAGALSLLAVSATPTSQVTFRGNLLQNNQATGSCGALSYSGTIDVLNNQFIGNHAGGSGGAICHSEYSQHDVSNAVYEGNLLRGNSADGDGGGLFINTTYSENLVTDYRNMAFIDNSAGGKGGAIYMNRYTNAATAFTHLTFSGNTAGDDTTINNFDGTMVLTNVILANTQVGILNRSRLLLNLVLFDGVTTPVTNQGLILQDTRVSGSAALETDGVHLTNQSDAVDTGVDAGLIYDIDEQPRPMGNAPDLGADESPFNGSNNVQAWILKSQPEWKILYTGTSVPPSSVFEQTYLIPFANGTTTQEMTSYSLHDQLPAALNLASEKTLPDLIFTPSSNSLNWSSLEALQPTSWGWIDITGQSDTVTPGTVLATNGQMDYTLSDSSSGSIPFSTSTTVPERPLFPPLLLSPRNGEMCLDEAHQLTANGLSSAGSIVKLYENGILKASVTANGDGEYNMTWVSALTQTQPVEVHAVSCELGGSCSDPSSSVYLRYPEGNWCPQRSYWEGDAYGIHYEFHFRNDEGAYATQDFLIPGTAGFINTKLHLYSCCNGEANPFRVLADGMTYQTPDGHSGHWWEFDIANAHDVAIYSDCGGGGAGSTTTSYGTVLIDPDGFVFNQAEGGSYDSATLMYIPVHPLAGFTVTAYYWAEEWNTWITWPAHLYDNQVNPQETPASGYFAFFTPPGKYYLEVTGKDGYQSWQSPVIEVVSEVVHMNAPLTEWSQATPSTQILVSPSELSQPGVIIPVGGSVEWQATADIFTSALEFNQLMSNPLQRLLSDSDPLLDLNGWDAGRMAPGEVYHRLFNQAGIYSYSDGYGHSGQVVVTNQPPIFLPVIRR